MAEPGLSAGVQARLHEVALGGHDLAIVAARSSLPVLHRRLLELNVVSSREALSLLQQLGIVTLPDLQLALDDGRLKQIAEKALDERLRPAAAALDIEARRLTLGRAADITEQVLAAIARCCPRSICSLPRVTCGASNRWSVRSSSSAVHPTRGARSTPWHECPAWTMCGTAGSRRAVVAMQQVEVDIRIAAPDDYGTVLFNATGSRAHLRAVYDRRHQRPRLSPGEEALYAHAGLPFIAPELREGAGEVEAAAAGALPGLVQREHIRGDLHMHTVYSDGADTLDAMVAECAALGYEYIAITDHSERAGASRTLSRGDLERQGDDIAAIRERYPRMTILHGVEVDIMPDGRLDFEDAVLERLDIVLASLHDSAQQDGSRLTARCIRAIRHPLVTIITHPGQPARRPAIGISARFRRGLCCRGRDRHRAGSGRRAVPPRPRRGPCASRHRGRCHPHD